jgi:hypothetical protein
MPDWLRKVAISLVTTIAVAALGWSWSLNSRLAVIERDLAQVNQSVAVVQTHDAAIAVIESRLGYIEDGITEIKVLLRER